MRVFVNLVVGIGLGVIGQMAAAGQQTPVPPPSTATPAHPFFITKTWIIGGVGDWDYLTMDPATRELFIAHGPMVQVVDVDSGTVAGSVKGFRQAHAVVLDGQGVYGYVSDGQADVVRGFDRRSPEASQPREARGRQRDAPEGRLPAPGAWPPDGPRRDDTNSTSPDPAL